MFILKIKTLLVFLQLELKLNNAGVKYNEKYQVVIDGYIFIGQSYMSHVICMIIHKNSLIR